MNESVEEAALLDWVKALTGKTQGQISEACEKYIRNQPRKRPTPGDLLSIINAARVKDGPEFGKGDWSRLSHDDRHLLTTEIIPLARRWLSIPALAQHGRKTLEFWGQNA